MRLERPPGCYGAAKTERGAILVLAAAFLLVLTGLCLLVIGTAFLVTSETRIQNASNLAALSALQEFVSKKEDDYNTRAESGLNRAKAILDANPITNMGLSDFDLNHEGAAPDGGEISYGMWWPQDPDGNGAEDPCSGNYPCFAGNQPPPVPTNYTGAVNAVKVSLEVAADSPLLYPFSNFSGDGVFLRTDSIASIVERCSIIVLDVSGSVIAETHQNVVDNNLIVNQGAYPRVWYSDQTVDPAQFAYRASALQATPQATPPVTICGQAPPPNWNGDQFFWCNMIYGRAAPNPRTARPTAFTPAPKRHFMDDYQLRVSPFDFANPADGTSDWVWMDVHVDSVYKGPEPLTRFLSASNGMLRLMQSQQVVGDKVAVIGFTGSIRSITPSNGLAEELGELIQITNPDNRGTKTLNVVQAQEVHPNFIDKGLFPLFSFTADGAATNLTLALQTAINLIAQNCSDTSKKSIILLTDGVASCFYDEGTGNYTCSGDYTSFQEAEDDLLFDGDSILSQLQANSITLTAIWDGSYVRPNTIDRRIDSNGDGSITSSDKFMNFTEARTLGYNGYCGQPNAMFDCQSSLPPSEAIPMNTDQVAYGGLGLAGYIFGRPNGLLGKLALDSGGIPCPLLSQMVSPMCSGSCYEEDPDNPDGPEKLKDSMRADGVTRIYAEYNLSKTEQAAKCALDTLGQNPFTLVDDPND